MQSYAYGYYPHTVLPPGKHVYSSQFPAMMQQLSPSYTIATEPVFMDHLLMHLGKKIRVVTTGEPLDGILTGVAIDHLQLTIGDANYHIRYQQVVYFIAKKE